jgi:predicted nucleic acid-binding protein
LKFPVSNAGPLITLGRINHLHLLPQLFGQVIIPHAVFIETTLYAELPGAIQLRQATWLQTQGIQDVNAVEQLLFSLEQGESEAIVLAQELNTRLFMDERRGRLIATTMGLAVTGSVGILVAAKQRLLIPEIVPLLDLLIGAGVYISPRL